MQRPFAISSVALTYPSGAIALAPKIYNQVLLKKSESMGRAKEEALAELKKNCREGKMHGVAGAEINLEIIQHAIAIGANIYLLSLAAYRFIDQKATNEELHSQVNICVTFLEEIAVKQNQQILYQDCPKSQGWLGHDIQVVEVKQITQLFEI